MTLQRPDKTGGCTGFPANRRKKGVAIRARRPGVELRPSIVNANREIVSVKGGAVVRSMNCARPS